MATAHTARLTPARARRVGLELGGALVLVAGVLVLRSHSRSAPLAAALGLLLVGSAVWRPSALVPLAGGWMAMASAISRVTSPLALGLIYLVVFTPMAWLRRSLGRSPVARDRGVMSYWVKRTPRTADEARRAMERQF